LRLRTSTDAVGDIDVLRCRLVADGYIYLPRYLDVEAIFDVRSPFCEALADLGWLADPQTPTATARDLRFTRDSFAAVYPALQRVEQFHQLAHAERILGLVGALLHGEVFCHPAKVARIAAPSDDARASTKAHQDFVAMHVATDVITEWMPLTGCSQTRQGLRVIPGSHRAGFLRTDPSIAGARPFYLPTSDDDPRWATADFEPGDLVFFHSLTVHGGGPNTSDQVRLSMDVRYQLITDPLRAELTHPHGWPRTPDWDDLCVGWTDRRWVETPPAVRLAPTLPDADLPAYLTTLVAPPSQLLQLDRRQATV
jgi:hypothetical protein